MDGKILTAKDFLEEEAGFTFARRPYTVAYYPTEAEWLAARTQTIGASEVSAVLGISQYETREGLYARKMGLTSRSTRERIGDTPFTVRGKVCEPIIRKLWAMQYPWCDVYDTTGIIFTSTLFVKMHCSLDFVAIDRRDGRRIIGEIKTGVCSRKWGNECPEAYKAQVMAQLAITSYESATLVARVYPSGEGYTEATRDMRYMWNAVDFPTREAMADVVSEVVEFGCAMRDHVPPPLKVNI